MKQFFKKSTVYQNFKAEEDKELVGRQECLATQDEISDEQAKYDELNKKYQSLQSIMFSQQNGNDKKKNEPTATDVQKSIEANSHQKTPFMHTEPAPLDQQYDVPAQL
jgi:hypothetical protein